MECAIVCRRPLITEPSTCITPIQYNSKTEHDVIIYFTYDISQFILMSPYYIINYQQCVIKVVPVLVMETHGRVEVELHFF